MSVERAPDDPARQAQGPHDAPTADLGPPTDRESGGGVPLLTATLGRYKIRRMIGSGGMGTVYEAEQDQPRRVVALKVMRSGRTGASAQLALRRFQAEAQFLASLRHPGICQVYDTGIAEDTGAPGGAVSVPFIALEYIPGAAPITTFANTRSLGLRDRVSLYLRVVDAVEHGHTRGVIHRDLKPDNVLVGEDGEPKVIDFGIARALGHTGHDTSMTRTGQVLGTLQYMAPEQLSGKGGSADQRADVYALGVILYELLCGQPPYNLDGLDPLTAVTKLRDSSPKRPTVVRPGLDHDLETVILAAVERDPVRRYASARELAADLRRWLDGDAVEAQRPSVVTIAMRRTQRVVSKHRALAVLLIPLIATVAAQLVARTMPETLTKLQAGWVSFGISPNTTRPDDLADAVVVLVKDFDEAADIARLAGLPEADPAIPGSVRHVYGWMAERLSEAGAAGVMLDLHFPKPDPDVRQSDLVRTRTEMLNASIARVNRAGVPVVCTVAPFPLVPEPDVDPILTELSRWGRWGGADMNADEGIADVPVAVLYRDERLVPGFSLAAFAAKDAPGQRITFAVRAASEMIEIRHEDPIRGSSLRATIPVVIRPAPPGQQNGIAFPPDSMIASVVVPVPGERLINERSFSARALVEEPDSWRERVRGKTVFIGFANDNDPETWKTTMPNVFAHVAGYGAIIGGGITLPGPSGEWIIAGLSACLATGASLMGFGRPRRALLAVAGAALMFTVLFCIGYQLRYLVGPAIPTVAFAFASGLSLSLVPSRFR